MSITALTSSSPTLTPVSILALCKPAPCDFALDLAADGANRGAVGGEEGGHLLGRLLHIARDARHGAVDIGRLDEDFGGLGGLDLERLVDQIAQHLLAQGVDFVGRDRVSAGDREERDALVDVGLGNDFAIDDRGRLDDLRQGRAVDHRMFRQAQRCGTVHRGRAGFATGACAKAAPASPMVPSNIALRWRAVIILIARLTKNSSKTCRIEQFR